MAREKKTEEVKAAEEKVGVSALAVHDAKGNYIRTYSATEHGEGFVKLAEQFAGKVGGSVKKA